MNKQILLASSSPYRKALLAQLGVEFETHAPNIDESAYKGESAKALALRLSISKAQACQALYPEHYIIASDQVPCLALNSKEVLLSKPGNIKTACEQLRLCNNKYVHFYTGLCLLVPNGSNDHLPQTQQPSIQRVQTSVERFSVKFRQLSEHEIQRYITMEQPLNCAGSFKVEGLGIHLFDKLDGSDQNSLIGLPLLKLCQMLRNVGINPIE